MEDVSQLPVQRVPHDALRQGLAALKDDAELSHPVEAMQADHGRSSETSQQAMLANLYGSAVPARMRIEQQILGRVQRLPGLSSSNVLLESLMGDLDDFDVESYIGKHDSPESAPVDLHSQMDSRLKLGGINTTRPFF